MKILRKNHFGVIHLLRDSKGRMGRDKNGYFLRSIISERFDKEEYKERN